MHASFNALASLAAILAFVGVSGIAVDTASYLGLFAAIAFAFIAIEHVRSVIATADYPALLQSPPVPSSSRPKKPA